VWSSWITLLLMAGMVWVLGKMWIRPQEKHLESRGCMTAFALVALVALGFLYWFQVALLEPMLKAMRLFGS